MWTNKKPTKSGMYWVWQPEGEWPCKGRVHLVEVEESHIGLDAWVPYMDYSDPLIGWENSYWSGPVDTPRKPSLEELVVAR